MEKLQKSQIGGRVLYLGIKILKAIAKRQNQKIILFSFVLF